MRIKTWDQASNNHVSSRRGVIGESVRALLQGISNGRQRARQRHDLAGLSDYQLRDVGLTRAEVGIEVSKPFWRD